MKKRTITFKETVGGISGSETKQTFVKLETSDYISALASQRDIQITDDELKFVQSKDLDAIALENGYVVIDEKNFLYKADITNKSKIVYFIQHGG